MGVRNREKRGWQYWQAPASRGPHKTKDFDPIPKEEGLTLMF